MGRFAKIGARVLAALIVLAGIVLAIVYRGAIDPAAVRDAIAHNPLAPLIFVTLQIAASLLWVPRTVLGITAGLLFGFVWGSIWAIVGALAGAAVGFAFIRWMGAEKINIEASPRLGPWIERAERGGWRAVAIMRLLPLHHGAVNTALGLTRLSWPDYLLGSFAGMLPMTLVQVDIGAAGGVAIQGRDGWVLACVLLATGLAASFLLKRAVSNRSG